MRLLEVSIVALSEPAFVAIGGFIVVAYAALKLFPDLETVVFLVPGMTITRPWQVVTAGFFEDSGLNMVLGFATLLVCAGLLRPTWGGRELVRFILVTNVAQGCVTWVSMIVLYVVVRSEHFLFARLGGLTGLLGGLSVALRQYACGHATLLALPVSTPTAATTAASSPAGLLLNAALPHAPSLSLLWAALVLLTTHAGPPDELLFAFNGTLVAWVYLRYYQPREASTAGDPSANFTFAALFPAPVRPPLSALGEASFTIVSLCGCFPPAGWSTLAAGGCATRAPILPPRLSDLLQTPAAVTTSDQEVAERRRARARALIEARLAEKSEMAMLTPPTPATSSPV